MNAKIIGEKIKILRELNGMKQEELADRLNIARNTVGMWEIGKRRPNDNVKWELAQILGISVIDLYFNDGFLNLLKKAI